LTSEQDCQRLQEAWRDIPGVQKTSSEDGTITLLVDDSNLVLPALFEAASATSVRIDKVDIQEPNLESVFLHLTGKALRD
jgi:ABC-2 type transport system ATP-binding protein